MKKIKQLINIKNKKLLFGVVAFIIIAVVGILVWQLRQFFVLKGTIAECESQGKIIPEQSYNMGQSDNLEQPVSIPSEEELQKRIYGKDVCYKEIAQKYNDISLCDKIVNLGIKNTCIAVLRQNISICNSMEEGPDKNFCYKGVAIAKKDISICDKIDRQMGYIESWCYVDVAIAKKDISICDKMEYEDNKNHCYADVAIAKKDISICDKIEYGVDYRNYCSKSIMSLIQ